VRSASEQELAHSVEELKMLVSASAESGVVQGDEEEMVHAVLDFGDTLVRQVMVPRTEMVAVPADASLDAVLQTLTEQPVTKLPVYEVDRSRHRRRPPAGCPAGLAPAGRRHPDGAHMMRETLFVPDTGSHQRPAAPASAPAASIWRSS
jgi:hypothetical protein